LATVRALGSRPDDLAATLGGCGGTALRETEIMLDGQAAGVAPVFP
jgi:hypothetical protein